MAVMRFSHMSKVMMTLSECNIVLPDEFVRSMADGLKYYGCVMAVLQTIMNGFIIRDLWILSTSMGWQQLP